MRFGAGTFPDHSWATIKRLPGNLIERFPKHVLRIRIVAKGFAQVTIVTGKTEQKEDVYMNKLPNGWEVLSFEGMRQTWQSGF